MDTWSIDGLTITLGKEGSGQYLKASYPVRYGRYAEIKNRRYIFQFNLNGEIKFIQGQSHVWHHNEWLKRTVANDWIYYTTNSYSSLFSLIGEYYLPCFAYDSNPYAVTNPFTTQAVTKALAAAEHIRAQIAGLSAASLPEHARAFLRRIAANDPALLAARAEALHTILGCRVTVLPPDTRDVDYDVIPVMIADGCLYKCGFCSVKTGQSFAPRSRQNILGQLQKLKDFYGPDLRNYNSLLLGQHDALFAGQELIEYAAEKAYELLELERSFMSGPRLFLFGSVGSLLAAPEALFRSLNATPFFTSINIGLESAQQESLDLLQKPLQERLVRDSFARMMDINKAYERIEISANFVTGDPLPEQHITSMAGLVAGSIDRQCSKGAIYLSPLSSQEPLRKIRDQIYALKRSSRMPVFLYLMQRL